MGGGDAGKPGGEGPDATPWMNLEDTMCSERSYTQDKLRFHSQEIPIDSIENTVAGAGGWGRGWELLLNKDGVSV